MTSTLTRFTRIGRAILLLLAFSSLAQREARADPSGKDAPPIHVVAIRSEGSYDQADALTGAIRSRVRAQKGYSLGDGDFALEVLMIGLKCDDVADDACQAKIGDHIHADRFVWGTIEHVSASKQVTAELHLWVRGQPPASTRLTYSDNLTTPGDESLRRLVDDGLKKLLRSSQPAAPERVVAPVAAPVKVAPRAASPSAPAITSPSAPATSSTASARRVVGWAGIGLGSFFLAAGLYSLVRVHDVVNNDRYELYQKWFPSNVDPCDEARANAKSGLVGAATPTEMHDFCSELSTFETLEIVFFGAAAISAGTGIYLLATDSSARSAGAPPSLQLTGSAGPRGGRLQVSVHF